MDSSDFYIPGAELPTDADSPSAEGKPNPATASKDKRQSTTKTEGLPELLQVLRDALKEDTQTAAFKQISKVQQAMQGQQVLLQGVSPQPPSQPIPPAPQQATMQYQVRPRHCTINDRGCLWKSPKVDHTTWQREIARLETAESGFLCCCLVFIFLVFISKQITFTTPAPLEEYGAKKKKSSSSRS